MGVVADRGDGTNDCGDCNDPCCCCCCGRDDGDDSSCRGSGGSGRTRVLSFVFDDDAPVVNRGLDSMHSAGITGIGDEGDGNGAGGSGRGEVGGGGVRELFARSAAVAALGAGGAVRGLELWFGLLRMCWRMEGTRGRRDASMSLELKRSVGAAGADVRGNTGSARLRLRP